jgi:hypothetical protein
MKLVVALPTILVDLEKHQVIELLPDRSPTAWKGGCAPIPKSKS